MLIFGKLRCFLQIPSRPGHAITARSLCPDSKHFAADASKYIVYMSIERCVYGVWSNEKPAIGAEKGGTLARGSHVSISGIGILFNNCIHHGGTSITELGGITFDTSRQAFIYLLQHFTLSGLGLPESRSSAANHFGHLRRPPRSFPGSLLG
jgi:hypothetical protein